MRLQGRLLLGACMAAACATAFAADPQPPRWGAIASNYPAWGYAYDHPTRQAAEREAQAQCERSARRRGVLCEVRVTFDRDVSKCSYTATMSQPDSGDIEQNGFINVSSVIGDPKAVLVRTRDTTGAPAPRGFTVQVWC